jgi:hypothetical protein
MSKVAELINQLNQEELKELKERIEKGEIKKTIENKLEAFKTNKKVCPVCNSKVGEEGLTLFFGPADLKQKATFDGIDCLEYFLYKLRKD